MAMAGSADLLFAALFLFSLSSFVAAEKNPRSYITAGILAGLACLTRYNGVPLFPLYILWVFVMRPHHRWEKNLWTGLTLGAAIFSCWFVRNALTFGSPLYTEYAREFSEKSPSTIAILLRNIVYYSEPQNNILPILLICSIIGIVAFGRSHLFLVLAMLAGWSISLIWWVQGMRFMMVGFPILLAFAFLGLRFSLTKIPVSARSFALGGIVIGIILTHASALCLYTYGSCNAWIDSKTNIFKKNLGLSTEGLFRWKQARDALSRMAESGATVRVENLWDVRLAEGIYRKDFHVIDSESPLRLCPYWRITAEPKSEEETKFRTPGEPYVFVVRYLCKRKEKS